MKYPILLFALVPLLSGCAKWEQKQFDASLVGLTPEQRAVVAVVSGRDTGVDPAQYLSPSAIALGQQFRAEEKRGMPHAEPPKIPPITRASSNAMRTRGRKCSGIKRTWMLTWRVGKLRRMRL
jgi:hypothetical protein